MAPTDINDRRREKKAKQQEVKDQENARQAREAIPQDYRQAMEILDVQEGALQEMHEENERLRQALELASSLNRKHLILRKDLAERMKNDLERMIDQGLRPSIDEYLPAIIKAIEPVREDR
jgi:tRNA A37 N6-isopentenylltransferase MiaA